MDPLPHRHLGALLGEGMTLLCWSTQLISVRQNRPGGGDMFE